MQMHPQGFPATDTETGSDINVVNHSTTPYLAITNLNTQILTSLGASLNDKTFSFVLWGVANKTNEYSHLMLNLPVGTYKYNDGLKAVQDANNYSVYSIPQQFNGVGFLIARFTYRYKDDAWILFDTEDLRGYTPNTTAGGGGGGTGVVDFLGLNDTPSAYTGEATNVVTVAAGETALEFTSKMSDLVDDTTPQLGGDLDANGNIIVAADHTVSGTAQVVNVIYGTGNPPAASGYPEGTLYIKYTA